MGCSGSSSNTCSRSRRRSSARGRLGDLRGRRPLLLGGLVLFAVGALLAGTAPTLGMLVAARATQGGYLAPIVVLTASYALFQAANTTAVMKDVDADQRGVVAALLHLSRNLGLVIGTSVMGAGAGGRRDARHLRRRRGLTFAVAGALAAVALTLAFAANAGRNQPRHDGGRPARDVATPVGLPQRP